MLIRMFDDSFANGKHHLTVTDLTKYLRQLLDSDEILINLWVRGEVSNAIQPASGHLYFTLKDSGASLKCVMWKNAAARFKPLIKDGTLIEVRGAISIYEAGGQYQLYAEEIRLLGEGAYYQEFLRLKKLLGDEGLFDQERKKPIPDRIKKIGIVTSITGAALQDMLKTINRRNPFMEVIISGTTVQGADAPVEIMKAISNLIHTVQPDVILLARGGGSIEDLWAFNDESLVRLVAESPVPVITGIGHETDFTLVDFAADLRAPTPTGAAELATKITLSDLSDTLSFLSSRLESKITNYLEQKNQQKDFLKSHINFQSPIRLIKEQWQYLDEKVSKLYFAQKHGLMMETSKFQGLHNRLYALNPAAVLKRGYAIITETRRGTLVTSIEQVSVGESLTIQVQDGKILSDVTVKDRRE